VAHVIGADTYIRRSTTGARRRRQFSSFVFPRHTFDSASVTANHRANTVDKDLMSALMWLKQSNAVQ